MDISGVLVVLILFVVIFQLVIPFIKFHHKKSIKPEQSIMIIYNIRNKEETEGGLWYSMYNFSDQ